MQASWLGMGASLRMGVDGAGWEAPLALEVATRGGGWHCLPARFFDPRRLDVAIFGKGIGG